MGLYDREYMKKNISEQNSIPTYNINTFVKQTYQLFGGSLLAGAVGAYIGLSFIHLMSGFGFIAFIILELALLFGVYALKNKPGINLIMLFAFTFMTGFTTAPLIGSFLGRGMGDIVAEAFILTSISFIGLSLFAMNTKKDFSTMSKMLFITLIIVVVASLINIFLHSPLLQLIIASVSAILFSFFIIYDTQNIINGAYSHPIEAAIALYLDFFNLFVSLLQLLGFFNNED